MRKRRFLLIILLGISVYVFATGSVCYLVYGNTVTDKSSKLNIDQASDTVKKYLDYNVPVISIQTDPDNLYDDEIGIFVEGNLRKEWWEIHRGEKLDDTTIFLAPANFWQRGKDWERPVYIEVFDPVLGRVISQNAGMRIHGGWSRGNNNQKSVRLFAREEYDRTNNTFNYEFFPNLTVKNNSNRNLVSFKRIVLRNGGNDYGNTRIRDEVMQDIAAQAGLDTQASRPAVFILNNAFYGVTQIKQTYDRYYFRDNYGAKTENVVILEVADRVGLRLIEGKESDIDDFYELRRFIAKGGKKEDAEERMAKIESALDVEETLLYYAFQIYIGNGDWPHNNVRVWRYNNPNSVNRGGCLDGRWRFLLFDTDFGFGIYGDHNVDILSKCLDEAGDGGLFRGLMQYDKYKKRFIEIMYDLMYNYFNEDNTDRVIALRQLEIAPVMSLISDVLSWDGLVHKMRVFIRQRNDVIIRQINQRLGEYEPDNIDQWKNVSTNNGFIKDYMKNRVLVRGTLYGEDYYVIKEDGKHYVPAFVLNSLGTNSLDAIRKSLVEKSVTIKNPVTGKSGQYVALSDIFKYEKLYVTYLEDINSLIISKN